MTTCGGKVECEICRKLGDGVGWFVPTRMSKSGMGHIAYTDLEPGWSIAREGTKTARPRCQDCADRSNR